MRRRWRETGLVVALLLTAAAVGCDGEQAKGRKAEVRTMERDIHSFARPDRVRVTHAQLDWTVDFDAREVRGAVTWKVERVPGAEEEPLLLDTRGLVVERVTGADGAPRRHGAGEAHPVLGTPLRIELRPDDREVTVAYRTGPESAGLQWLTPAQTAARRMPFLFSQGQSILTRTYLPCQDSPGVRFTFDATVRVPEGMTAVMGAERLEREPGDPFRFRMPEPIPSYLVAIAAGEIDFRPLGPRTGVFAEPPVVESAAREFADTEAMLEAAETLYGPYRWGRYDLIVLPPSFPFGGMENPRLTFATPTILAGDRSLVSLVAHELAHSWSGNLVTNATWSDFWLNEGFTVYLERRIQEAIYGRDRSEMEAVLGKQDLLEEMPTLQPEFTVLHNVSLEGRDPDDAFSEVPYEKGYLFLRLLEETFGREAFDSFLRRWFDTNAFESRTTQQFQDYLQTELLAADPARAEALAVAEWLYRPGLPANAPEPQSVAFERAARAAAELVAGELEAAELPGPAWTTHEWRHFLRSLPHDLPPARMAALDAAWRLSDAGNAEILSEWLLLAIRTGYRAADPALERFLTVQGRRKFLKPLYTELARTPEGRARALAIYDVARPGYHAVSTNTIDGILDYREGSGG